MALTKEQAAAIIKCVENDADSVKVINSWLRKVLPDRWGLAGGLRNWGYVLTGQDPTDPEVAANVCTGIANATSLCIDRSKSKLKGVRGATTVDRVHWGVHHTATLIDMHDNTSYVFDWHATLNPSNPLIGKVADWKNDDNCTDFDHFEGIA